MNRYLKSFALATLLLLVLMPIQAYAKDKSGWKILGSRTVSSELDRDQIMVKAKKGTFTKLKLQVKKAPLEMERFVVHFGNGEKQVVWLRKNFDDGDWSRPVNIKGKKRVIKKVVLWYSSEGEDTPVVHLWGKQ